VCGCPFQRKKFLRLLGTSDQCSRVSGLYMQLSHAAGLYGVRGFQIVDASTWPLASIWFSQPRLMTVVPYSPSPFSHRRFTPTRGAKFMQPAVEFDNSLLWLLRPKQFGQACLPVQSPPAYEACVPASWQAMIQVVDLSGWPNG
jgi:hypothetical protein